ncbi:MAG: DUF4062 domain-containing protein [Pseudomonadota bacterium]
MAKKPKLIVMVSSTVYGIEELLDRVYAILSNFGYEVWMSHKGTVPVLPTKTAFENCLDAVQHCDLFLSIITTQYGSGKEDKDALSITHQELLKAIELNKPRWILAHDHVVFARTLLNNLGYTSSQKRSALSLKKNMVIDDLRVIDMYETAIRHEVHIKERKGNWVQKFITDDDAHLFASAQFYRYQEVERFLAEHLEDSKAVEKQISKEVKP